MRRKQSPPPDAGHEEDEKDTNRHQENATLAATCRPARQLRSAPESCRRIEQKFTRGTPKEALQVCAPRPALWAINVVEVSTRFQSLGSAKDGRHSSRWNGKLKDASGGTVPAHGSENDYLINVFAFFGRLSCSVIRLGLLYAGCLHGRRAVLHAQRRNCIDRKSTASSCLSDHCMCRWHATQHHERSDP